MDIVKPKGKLIPIGGGEDKEKAKSVLCRMIAETGKEFPKICLITLATDCPEDVAKTYTKAFEDLKMPPIDIIHYDRRPQADTPENLQKIEHCDLVLFSGGDQYKLTTLLGGTELLHRVKSRYYDEPNFVVAGTSAGAAAMSNTMIVSGSSEDALIKGELELTNGLDLINSVFIDTHFTQRGRFGRLIQTVTGNPGVLGLGLGEDTSVIVTHGEELEVYGSGLVVIVDGCDITYTNLVSVKHGKPITVEGIKMHVLGPEQKFLISERRIEPKAS